MALISLFFCGGQSNAKVQWADAIEAALIEYGVTNAQVVWAYHPGEWLYQWYMTTPQANYLADFDDSAGGGTLRDAIDAIELAGNTWSLDGFFWFQGEGDTGNVVDQAAYFDRFTAMLSQLADDFGVAGPPVSVAVIDANQDPFYDDPANLAGRTRADIEAVRSQLFAIGALPGNSAVDTRGYARTDAFHLTTAELQRLAVAQVKLFLGVEPVSYADLIADAAFHDQWPCQDNAANTTIASLTGTHNGTLAGGDNTSAKRIAGPNAVSPFALRLNGTDDNLNLGTLPQGATSNPCTILLHCRPNTVNATLRAFFQSGISTTTAFIYRTPGNVLLYAGAGGSHRWDYVTWIPPAGSWIRLAVRYDGTNPPSLRVDGVNYTPSATTGTPVFNLTTGATLFGGASWPADLDIADVGFFTRYLTADEIDAWFVRPAAGRAVVRDIVRDIVRDCVRDLAG